MASITATAQPNQGRVRLDVSFAEFTSARMLRIWRRVAGVLTEIRNADPGVLSHGLATVYDVEAPLDTPLSYRAWAPLNANGSMETSVQEWQAAPTVGTAEQTREFYFTDGGRAALRLTPTGVAATIEAFSESIAVSASTSYEGQARLMVPTTWDGGISVVINWYTSGSVFISTSAGTVDTAPTPGVWKAHTVSATSPGTAAFARIGVRIAGTPPTWIPLYADEVYLTHANSTVESATVVVGSDGGGWWKNPLYPARNVRLLIGVDRSCVPQSGTFLVSVGAARTRRAAGSSYEPHGYPRPVPGWDVRRDVEAAQQVVTRALVDAEQVAALHAPGAPTLLQLPAQYGEPDQYQAFTDLTETRLVPDHRHPSRQWEGAFTRVDAPVGPSEGVYGTRYQDLTRYATYADITAAGVTWQQVLQGAGAL